MVQPNSVVDRRQAWGDGGSPCTSSIIVLTCIPKLEPDSAKLTNVGLVSEYILQVAPIQAKAIRGCIFFNAVAMQTVNRVGRNAKTFKLHAGVACTCERAWVRPTRATKKIMAIAPDFLFSAPRNALGSMPTQALKRMELFQHPCP